MCMRLFDAAQEAPFNAATTGPGDAELLRPKLANGFGKPTVARQ